MNIDDAAEKWLYELGTLYGKSVNTVKTYRVSLGHFLRYLKGIGKLDTGAIVPNDVTDCAEWLQEDGEPIEHRTLVAYATTMNQWVDWLSLEELVVLNVTAWQRLQSRLKKMREGVSKERKPRLPDEEEVHIMLGVAEDAEGSTQRKQLIALRNNAMVQAFFVTGARVSELASLLRENLRNKSARIVGKGDKEREIYFDERSWHAIETYLAARDKAGLAVGENEPVFSRHDRRASHQVLPLSTNSFRRSLDMLCKMAGIKHLTPHQLRHLFATMALRDLELGRVQKLLGHADPGTTVIYAQLTPEQLKQAHSQINLRGREV